MAQHDEVKSILNRVERESGTFAASDLARTANQHSINEAPQDSIEILGKRIGRVLGWIGVIVLIALIAQDLGPYLSNGTKSP